jgi:multidrug efflux pump subunit AcrB
VYRYNRFRAIQILGGPSPSTSSGAAADTMEKVALESLPAGYAYEWTGTTYQEKLSQGHEGVIFGFAALLVFLALAALYESWSIPFAVLLERSAADSLARDLCKPRRPSSPHRRGWRALANPFRPDPLLARFK